MTYNDKTEYGNVGPLVGRRRILVGLATVIPAVRFLRPGPAWAQAEEDMFLTVSRVVTGTDALSAGVADRIEKLLTDRVEGFESKLADLAAAMQKAGDNRDAQLRGLSDDQVAFALQIAKPWYLGYVGEPSNSVLQDDAAFATFLEAQAYVKVSDIIPLQTYPRGAAGWWKAVPDGVDASDLPPGADSWDFQPRDNYQIAAPDPAWRAYAAGDYDDIEAAKAAIAGGSGPASDANTGDQ
jgi:hypothetical protein